MRTLVIRFISTFIYCDQYCTATIYSATCSARGTHIVYVFPNKQSINQSDSVFFFRNHKSRSRSPRGRDWKSSDRRHERSHSDRGRSHSTREKDAKVRLYVSNIPYDIRWQDLKDMFREKGTFYVLSGLEINSFPLEPAVTAFHDHPLNHLKPAAWPPDRTTCLDKSIYCAHKTMTLHPQMLSTTFANNLCTCQSSSFTGIRLICSVFVEFIS